MPRLPTSDVPALGALARLWTGLIDGWRFYHLPRRHRRNIIRAQRLLTELAPWAQSGQDRDRMRLFTYLRQVDPYVFEDLVLEAFVRSGHRVRRNRRYTGDGGVDGRVLIRGIWCPVQSKRYSDHISRAHVAAFAALPGQHPIRLFVHTGAAVRQDLGGARSVLIVSGPRLVALLAGRSVVTEWLQL